MKSFQPPQKNPIKKLCRACSFCARGAGTLETGSIDSAFRVATIYKKVWYNPTSGRGARVLQRGPAALKIGFLKEF